MLKMINPPTIFSKQIIWIVILQKRKDLLKSSTHQSQSPWWRRYRWWWEVYGEGRDVGRICRVNACSAGHQDVRLLPRLPTWSPHASWLQPRLRLNLPRGTRRTPKRQTQFSHRTQEPEGGYAQWVPFYPPKWKAYDDHECQFKNWNKNATISEWCACPKRPYRDPKGFWRLSVDFLSVLTLSTNPRIRNNRPIMRLQDGLINR